MSNKEIPDLVEMLNLADQIKKRQNNRYESCIKLSQLKDIQERGLLPSTNIWKPSRYTPGDRYVVGIVDEPPRPIFEKIDPDGLVRIKNYCFVLNAYRPEGVDHEIWQWDFDGEIIVDD